VTTNQKSSNFYFDEIPLVMTVHKDGKLGIYTKNFKEILPPEYDNIGYNSAITKSYTNIYLNESSKFYILEQDNLIGILALKFNNEIQDYEKRFMLEPRFGSAPAYIFEDYYNIPGLFLVVFQNYYHKYHFYQVIKIGSKD